MGTVNINGKSYSGDNINISGGIVTVGGVKVNLESDLSHENLQIVVNGDVMNLWCDASVICDNVHNLSAGGSVNCDDVKGHVQAGGSVQCDNVGGNVTAGGSVMKR
jgi:hypothetical protein